MLGGKVLARKQFKSTKLLDKNRNNSTLDVLFKK